MEAILQSPFGQTVLGTTGLAIGSTPDNQLVLSDASVTAHHAILHPEGQGYNLTDLGSTSGTFINEQRLSPHIPRGLQNGDLIRIGNIQLTYHVTTGSSIPPTVYAAPGQIGNQGYSPTILAADGNSFPPAVYGPPAQAAHASTSSPLVPPPSPTSPSNMSNPYETSASASAGSGYVPPPPVKKRSRRGLWITLGIIVGVFVVGFILLLFIIGSGPSSTPAQTFQSYCKDLKAHNAQAAYNLYSQGAKKQLTQDNIVATSNAINDCVVSHVDDTARSATITYTLISGGKLIEDDKVTNEDNEWKIDAQKIHATPTVTLYSYCNALKQGDYQTAYNQYSSALKSQVTEAQFESSFNSGKPTDCTLSNVDDNAGKGVITFTFSSGTGTDNETLVNENGTWKINSEQPPSTPTVTLNNYCEALKQGDYQTAYNQLSSDQQSTQTEAQFAANFNTNKVTDCSVSNIDDNAGTGTITYKLSNGNSVPADYTLTKEQDTWKIKTEKARS